MKKPLPENFIRLVILGTFLLMPRLSVSQVAQLPLVRLTHEEKTQPDNAGSLSIVFTKSAVTPAATGNVAPTYGGLGQNAYDFGSTPGNYYVESSTVLDGLKNLSGFTLAGWLNTASLTTGSGGNRIISWINNGGDGVDLVLQNNGSLRLGVDGWPDASPAFSSANKVTASAVGASDNWIFFAVTYQSNGQVRFYFGNGTDNATLDVSRTYRGAGVTGSAIGKLAFGAFNDATRNSGTWNRMFRGVLDDLRIYGSALSTTDIVAVQRNTLGDAIAPTVPTNVRSSFVGPTRVGLAWDAGSDNVGVVGYDIYDHGYFLASVGPVTTYTLTGLTSNRTYNIAMRSKDAAGNFSAYSPNLVITTPVITPNEPLLYMPLNDVGGGAPVNVGIVQGPIFTTGTGPSNTFLPGSSLQTPPYVGGTASADFGVTPGNAFIESQAPIDQLKSLNAFTITGWLNCKSNVVGSGGNRVVSWINSGGDGVDLVYQSNGSLRLGVDGWPDNSPAFSNPNKVTSNSSAPRSNWVFFAVTYQSNGQVQFYFGTNLAKATLDATKTYAGPGVTGSNIGKFAIGAFNSATRNASTYDRMFRGLIDDIRVFGGVLSLADVIGVQGKNSTDVTSPTPPTNLMATSKSVSTIALSWTLPTDNVAIDG
ncbi:MAG: LamG-like jellyroll fold domain-containing protein, partial [Chryseolinea sp.]